MLHDTWTIRWREYTADTYTYGSKIEFRDDKSVAFENSLIPPATVIHRWYSRTNFQTKRMEPTLPLIDGERPYEITLHADVADEDKNPLIMRIVFYDRYDNEAESIIVREKKVMFKPSLKTYSYCVELISGGEVNVVFRSLQIREISKEELDEEQNRIAQIKKDSCKDKRMRKKNRKIK